MKAKKSFGQHFLKDQSIIETIVKQIEVVVDEYKIENVLEIGPGKGALTRVLKKLNVKLKLVEADKDMVQYLTATKMASQEEIIFDDILKLNLDKCFNGEKFIIVGNFPYNISSQIVFKMLEHKDLVPCMVGMFQKEMADRIGSKSGSKIFGIISIITQIHYSVRQILVVNPESFSPPPRVMSSVIRLDQVDPLLEPNEEIAFVNMTKKAFGQRRKMLRNTLNGVIPADKILLDPIFLKRPEALSIDELIALYRKYIKTKNE